MTTTTTTAESDTASRGLAIILVPVGLTLILADVAFWNTSPGISVGLFTFGLAVMLLACVRTRPRLRLAAIFGLLLACCVQAAVETSLSNVVAIVALTVALAGEVFQPHLATWWARISEVLFGLVTAPARLEILFTSPRPQSLDPRDTPRTLGENLGRAASIAAPALVLLLIFGSLLGAGNAVFAKGISSFWTHTLDWIGNLDLSFQRMVFWGATAMVALGIFHRTLAPGEPRWWTFALPRVPRRDSVLALWQSGAVLLVLNALFLVINTIDAVYLWFSKVELPKDVGLSQYLHEGVHSLIAAVVLSAIVIAGLFQQKDEVVGKRWMKLLAHLWVAQNLLLIAGTFLRLKLYVDEHHLTEKRIYVACFLALVTVGFLLLAWFVQKRRSFNWLLGSNALATLALFFVLQFANVTGWVAQTNIARWRERWDAAQAAKTPAPWLDVEYLFTLGPGAWPALQRLSIDGRDPVTQASVEKQMAALVANERARAESEGWQSWQARRSAARKTIGANPKTP